MTVIAKGPRPACILPCPGSESRKTYHVAAFEVADDGRTCYTETLSPEDGFTDRHTADVFAKARASALRSSRSIIAVIEGKPVLGYAAAAWAHRAEECMSSDMRPGYDSLEDCSYPGHCPFQGSGETPDTPPAAAIGLATIPTTPFDDFDDLFPPEIEEAAA